VLGVEGLDGVVATSLLTSGSATLVASLIGIPLASMCSTMKSGYWKSILRVGVRSLYGLPPVVVGVWVYILLSKDGVLADLDWLFTIQGMIFAQSVLVLPLIWGGVWRVFEDVNIKCEDAMKMTGGSSIQILFMRLSLAKRGVMNSIAIGFGRAIAEVGAVLMIGGNIAGQTRVMTTSIVLETSVGNLDSALTLGFILLIMTASIMLFITPFRDFGSMKEIIPEKGSYPKASSFDYAKISGVSYSIDDVVILKEIDLELKGGEVVVILGESGSGKTSLLRAIAGLVEVNGSREGVPSPGPGGCQMVFQESAPLTSFVYKEVGLVNKLHSVGEFTGPLLDSIKMVEKIGAPISSLSGGELQRVMVARAISFSPSLLLLDEFTANLDGGSIIELEKMVERVKGEGGCIVISTHNVLQARRLADRVVVIHQGEIIAFGTIEELEMNDSDVVQSIITGMRSG